MPIIQIPCLYTTQYWAWHGVSDWKSIDMGNIQVGMPLTPPKAFRGAIRWSLSKLPTGRTVTKVRLYIRCEYASCPDGVWNITPFDTNGQAEPCSKDGPSGAFFNACYTGNPYIETTAFRVTGWYWFDLGANAVTDVQNAKSAVNHFSLGFRRTVENASGYSSLNACGIPTPAILEITFSGINFVGVGAANSSSGGSTGSLVVALPANLQVNDLMLCFCSARKDTQVFTATGWTALWHHAHTSSGINRIALLYRFYQEGDTNPTVTWTNGATNATTIIQICAFRNVDLNTPFAVQGNPSSNASQANIGPITGITTGANVTGIIVFGHRADDWTSVEVLSSVDDWDYDGSGFFAWQEIDEPDSTSGSDAGMVWDYAFALESESVSNKTFIVTGGAAQTGLGVILSINETLPTPPPAVGYSYSDGLVTVQVAG